MALRVREDRHSVAGHYERMITAIAARSLSVNVDRYPIMTATTLSMRRGNLGV